jgi:hypothetical protein
MFGPESKLFPKQSKAKGHGGNSQYPGQQAGDIPDWKRSYEYDLGREVMNPSTGLYYRCIVNHISGNSFLTDLGLGRWVLMFSGSSGPALVRYSNVLWVDPIHGNNGTALPGRFDLPYQTISQAASVAFSIGRSSNDKVLIHIRQGYYADYVGLIDWVDYYCEPGVVLDGSEISDGAYGAGTSNFYGYAVLKETIIRILNPSNCILEFDNYVATAAAIIIVPSSGVANITINADYIYAFGSVSAFAITVRGNSNVFINVSKSIECPHQCIVFRNHTGKCVVNCPKLIMTSGNVFGGNFKSVISLFDTVSGEIIINGDLVHSDDDYYGGTSSMVLVWSINALSGKFTLNGNIDAKLIQPINGNVTGGGSMIFNGDIDSVNFASYCYGNGKFLFRNSKINIGPDNFEAFLLLVTETAELYIKNCYMYNAKEDSSLVSVNGGVALLSMDNVVGFGEGVGFSLETNVGVTTVYVTNSRFNNIINPLITNACLPDGIVIDPNIKVPKF